MRDTWQGAGQEMAAPAAQATGRRGRLAGMVAIVTGASSGIGAVTAQELAARGATVVLAARREEELRERVAAILGAGGVAEAVPTDVSDESQLERLVRYTLDRYGRIDILVNNAGIGWTRDYVGTSSEDIRRFVDVNLLGVMLLTRVALPGMLARGRGAIIMTASVAGHIAVDPLYSATKSGVRAFSLALRRQLRGTGVSVSVVSPGFVRTPMTRRNKLPMPGPEVVARAIANLVTHPRREVVVPRSYRLIIWLERLLPWLADRLLRPRARRDGQRGAAPGATHDE